MRITDLEVWTCRFPLPAPFSPSWTPGLTSRDNGVAIFVVKTDEGIDGVAASLSVGREWAGLAYLFKAYLLGRDPLKIEDLVGILRNSTRVLGFRAGFLDVALWDILGKKAGLPLYKIFGGAKDELEAYASFGELREPAQWKEAIAAAKEAGFRAVKIRIRHETIAEDVACVEAAREAAGSRMKLMVDANQGWRIDGFAPSPRWDLARAKKTVRALEDLNIHWLEEPLDQYDLNGYRALRQASSVPIAGGEMLSDLGPFEMMLDGGAYDYVQPDTTFCGGISIARKVSALAEAKGVGYAPHTWTNGIGLAANMHVLAAAPTGSLLEFPWNPPGWIPSSRDAMLKQPFEIRSDGKVSLPKAPGLGVDLDFEAIQAHGERLA
ncbi:MAG: isomerase [Acidimicrobiia bacterium]